MALTVQLAKALPTATSPSSRILGSPDANSNILGRVMVALVELHCLLEQVMVAVTLT